MKQRPDVQDLLFSTLPNFHEWLDFLPVRKPRGQSWFEVPYLLERHHRRRKKATKARRKMRRTRYARRQNLRTGAHR